MYNTFAHGLVQLAGGVLKGCFGGLLVAGVCSLAGGANCALNLGADCLVALFSLAVGADPLDFGLNVGHVSLSKKKNLFSWEIPQNKLKLYQCDYLWASI